MPDNRYRVLERVAAGGMAEVFKGVAESIQGFRKTVAIKRVLPALTKNKKFVASYEPLLRRPWIGGPVANEIHMRSGPISMETPTAPAAPGK